MKLVVRSQDKVIREYPIAEGADLAIGRQPDVNDVVLDEIKASRKPGRLRCQGGQVQFTDLGSGNGTWMQEERLPADTAIDLKVGDALQIGVLSLVIEEGDAVDPAARTDPHAQQRVAAILAEGKTGAIFASGGGLDGQAFGLGEGSVVIGRVPECHIQIADTLSSRRNTEVRREGRQYKVKDLGSTNGTFLNDKKITEADLAEGDVIRIGEIRFRFSVVDAAGAPAVPTPKPAAPVPALAGAGAPAAAPAAAPKGSGGTMVAVVVVVLLAAGVGIYFGVLKKKPVEPGPNGAAGTTEIAPPVEPEKTFPVTVGKPVRLDIEVMLKKTGDVHGWKESPVTFPLGAKVDAVHVKNGDRVQVDQPLVALEVTDELKTSRNSLEARRAEFEQEVEKALRALKNAEDNLKIEQESYDRNKPLYDKGNLLQAEWDRIKRMLNNARTEADTSKKTVEQCRERVKQVQEDLGKIQSQIDDLTVKAKMAGVVTGLDLKKGYTVTQANAAMSIVEYEEQVKVVVAVPEDDIAYVKQGMAADVWLSKAPERTARGAVTLIPATATQRNYDVEMKVPNPETLFRPGAQVQVRFIVDVHKAALAVPAGVVGSGKRGDYYLFRLDSATGKVQRVNVKPGAETVHQDGKYVEILPDPESPVRIQDTDLIVFDGFKNLRDGAAVEVKNKAEVGLP